MRWNKFKCRVLLPITHRVSNVMKKKLMRSGSMLGAVESNVAINSPSSSESFSVGRGACSVEDRLVVAAAPVLAVLLVESLPVVVVVVVVVAAVVAGDVDVDVDGGAT
jgi:hypothetical protein